MLVVAVASVTFAKLSGEGPPEGVSKKADAPLATCERAPTRETCSEIMIDGRSWRYSISRASHPTADTVILDIGGPGQSVLTSPYGISAARGSLSVLSDYNLVVFEEPWVTTVPTPNCEASLTAFYSALRGDGGTAKARALDMSTACGINAGAGVQDWGFRPEQYERLVRSVGEKERLSFVGFLGHSWGVARLAYLNDLKFDWSVLIRPFPVGVAPDGLVDARAAALGPYTVPAALGDGNVTVPSRSVPVSRFDALSSWVSLAYVEDAEFSDVRAKLESGTDMALIGKMSDNYWGRYRVTSVSPAFLAQAQEVCAVVGGSGTPFTAVVDSRDIMRAGFLPCAGQNPAALKLPAIGRLCVVTSAKDAVVPEPLIRQGLLGGTALKATWVESTVRSHRSFDGGEECLRQTVTAPTPVMR